MKSNQEEQIEQEHLSREHMGKMIRAQTIVMKQLHEENKQQRESLDAFRELVKAQTKTIHDLNEENNLQGKLLKELTYESGGKWYTGLHGDSDITDIAGDLLK